MARSRNVNEIFETIKHHHNIKFNLKEEQIKIIESVIDGKDTFCLLKTGFGKSVCFMIPPLILDQMYPDDKHTALVVSPLKALMLDQQNLCKEHNIKSVAIMGGTDIDLSDMTDSAVVFASPEAIMLRKWSSLLKKFQKRICLQVYDEAHCISSWGLDFRPDYRRVSELQSLIDAPTLAMTATATKKIQEDIYAVLSLSEKTEVISSLPDRPNIFLQMTTDCKEIYREELAWIVDMVKSKKVVTKKTIIYVRSLNVCYEMYIWMCISLGLDAFANEKTVENRLIEMFHANTDEASKTRLLETFISVNSKIRVLISTVAFGMGVNVPDVEIIVHWGLPPTALSYWQETGRCGKDGRPSYAICYAYKRSVTKCEDDLLKETSENNECTRYCILKSFLLDGMKKNVLEEIRKKKECDKKCAELCRCDFCMCCSKCILKCKCLRKVENVREFYSK